MTAMTVAERMTASEYMALPPSRERTQLIGGEVVVDQPRWRHQEATKRLVIALAGWAEAEPGRGAANLPIDVLLGEFDVYAPDVVLYLGARAYRGNPDPPYAVPDLAVEVRSPSTWRYDVGRKKAIYEQRGLPELWLVDPYAETVLAFRRSAAGAATFDVAVEVGRGETLTSPRLPCFTLALDALFAD